MKWFHIVPACCVISAMALFAQQIPAGTALPVMLNSTLDAKKDKPGREISARIMQNVLLPDGTHIPAGARVAGHLVQQSDPNAASGSRLVLKFDQLLMHGRSVPLVTNLRAIASMNEVFEAQLPTNNFDEYGTTIADWTTVQVGGDVVYRGNGQVIAPDNQVVAKATVGGDVTAKLPPVPDRGCRGEVGGNDREEALWVFSTSACGTYGFRDLNIAHAGRTDPVGEIVLESATNVHVRGGSGLLLRVDGLGAPAAASQ